MLKRGFLASTNFYAATVHTDKEINSYFDALNEVYRMIYKCETGEMDVNRLLQGPVCHTGFQRLN